MIDRYAAKACLGATSWRAKITLMRNNEIAELNCPLASESCALLCMCAIFQLSQNLYLARSRRCFVSGCVFNRLKIKKVIAEIRFFFFPFFGILAGSSISTRKCYLKLNNSKRLLVVALAPITPFESTVRSAGKLSLLRRMWWGSAFCVWERDFFGQSRVPMKVTPCHWLIMHGEIRATVHHPDEAFGLIYEETHLATRLDFPLVNP